MKRISVCMASYNGAKYIKEQIDSILSQLGDNDELIISDDGSTDSTIDIIRNIDDSRIYLFLNQFHNHILNFECALSKATGDFIFLADQDDVWREDKVELMKAYLEKYDLVCSNCLIVNSDLKEREREFYHVPCEKRKGFFRNLFHNNYLGCCMAFRRGILINALPFPKGLITHDTWIGLVAELCGKTCFIDDKLIFFRRHDNNTSNTLNGSTLNLLQKIHYRIVILKGVVSNLYIRKNVQ